MSLSARYLELCNRRGNDWWSIVFGYPVARLVLVALAGVPMVTPTVITVTGFLTKCAAIALLFPWEGSNLVVAAVLLQVAQVFDSMDGTLARYRGTSSPLGAYLDKVFDAVTMFALCLMVGMRATVETGNGWNVIMGAAAGGAFLCGCYGLWVARGIRPPDGARLDGGAPAAASWSAVAGEWLRGWARIARFQEADLYFWIALGTLLGQWQWLVIFLCATQAGKALGVLVYHGVMVYRRAP